MEKRDSKTVAATKRRITDGLFEIMRDDPIERVTVREVCGRAGITRSTLYTHFSSVYAFACGADEDLPSAACGVVDVPVVAASRLERHVGEEDRSVARFRQRIDVGGAGEILGVGGVLLAFAENVVPVEFVVVCHSSVTLRE